MATMSEMDGTKYRWTILEDMFKSRQVSRELYLRLSKRFYRNQGDASFFLDDLYPSFTLEPLEKLALQKSTVLKTCCACHVRSATLRAKIVEDLEDVKGLWALKEIGINRAARCWHWLERGFKLIGCWWPPGGVKSHCRWLDCSTVVILTVCYIAMIIRSLIRGFQLFMQLGAKLLNTWRMGSWWKSEVYILRCYLNWLGHDEVVWGNFGLLSNTPMYNVLEDPCKLVEGKDSLCVEELWNLISCNGVLIFRSPLWGLQKVW